MADNIVESLFGPDPYQVQQARNDAMRQQAAQYANMAPAQRAAMGLYQAGAQLAGPVAGLLGMVDPAVEQAKQRQQTMSGVDFGTPESIMAAAQRVQDPKVRMQLMMLAQQKAAQQQDVRMKQLQALAAWKKANTEANPTAKLSPKDYTPESWAEYVATGDTSKLRAVPDATKIPSSVAEYQFALKEGYKGTYEQWVKDKARAGATSINLPAQEKGFETELGKLQAKRLIDGSAAAEDAEMVINTVDEGRRMLNAGIKSGMFANFKLGMGKALKAVGVNYNDNEIANTEAFAANMAQNVGRIIKQFGSGTGLSDADRQYAEKMAGGLITLDEGSIRKILDINERQAKWVISRQRALSKGVKTNIPLSPVARSLEPTVTPSVATPARSVRKYNPVTGKIE